MPRRQKRMSTSLYCTFTRVHCESFYAQYMLERLFCFVFDVPQCPLFFRGINKYLLFLFINTLHLIRDQLTQTTITPIRMQLIHKYIHRVVAFSILKTFHCYLFLMKNILMIPIIKKFITLFSGTVRSHQSRTHTFMSMHA